MSRVKGQIPDVLAGPTCKLEGSLNRIGGLECFSGPTRLRVGGIKDKT
jgi:hypothetical protein